MNDSFMALKGDYPFNEPLGRVDVARQDTPEQTAQLALQVALQMYGNHCVVRPATQFDAIH